MPSISDPRVGYSSGEPSVSTSDKPTTYTSLVKIMKPDIVLNENPTKDPSHVPKELPIYKQRNMLIEYPSGYPIGAPRNIPNEKKSSNPRSQTSSDPDVLKRGSQES